MDERAKERIRQLLSRAAADGTTPGALVLVYREGEEQLFAAEGYADLSEKKKLRRDHIFRLYSMTKPVTAAAAMLLMERGDLDLAQPVADFIPEFGSVQVAVDGQIAAPARPMTVFDLLNMTSGLTYGGDQSLTGRMTQSYLESCGRRLAQGNPVTTLEFVQGLAQIPLNFEPGASWEYGVSADVLGAVIERASGMRFGEFLRQELFGPLGMKDTGFYVPQEKQERMANAYEALPGGGLGLYTGDNLLVSNRMAQPPAFESGGAGLASTIDDYMRFAQMLLRGGELEGRRILSPSTVRYMTSGQLRPAPQEAYHRWVGLEGHTYGFLMRRLVICGQASILGSQGEYGWDGWLGCYFANLPQQDATILVMQQKTDSGTTALTRRIRNVIARELCS